MRPMAVINLVGAAFAGLGQAALAARAAMLDVLDVGPLLRSAMPHNRMVRRHGVRTSRYMPHQGPREIARRQRQAAR